MVEPEGMSEKVGQHLFARYLVPQGKPCDMHLFNLISQQAHEMGITLIYQTRKQRLRKIKAMHSTVGSSYCSPMHLSFNLVSQHMFLLSWLLYRPTNLQPTQKEEQYIYHISIFGSVCSVSLDPTSRHIKFSDNSIKLYCQSTMYCQAHMDETVNSNSGLYFLS